MKESPARKQFPAGEVDWRKAVELTIEIKATPLVDRPIIPPFAQRSDALRWRNINGPCLIRRPDWVPDGLGEFYLYFAHHKGADIELACANQLAGPWTIYEPGVLNLAATPFLHSSPPIPPSVDRDKIASQRAPGVPSLLEDCVIPHIASPEVCVDAATRTLRLYFHGLEGFGLQRTRVAISTDGLAFEVKAEILAPPYLRMFRFGSHWYGLAMPGQIFRSLDGISQFEPGPVLFEPQMRHAGIWRREDSLWVFFTRVGDAPERILLSTIDLRGDWMNWRESEALEVRRPTREWEGALLPVELSSRRSAAPSIIRSISSATRMSSPKAMRRFSSTLSPANPDWRSRNSEFLDE